MLTYCVSYKHCYIYLMLNKNSLLYFTVYLFDIDFAVDSITFKVVALCMQILWNKSLYRNEVGAVKLV